MRITKEIMELARGGLSSVFQIPKQANKLIHFQDHRNFHHFHFQTTHEMKFMIQLLTEYKQSLCVGTFVIRTNINQKHMRFE